MSIPEPITVARAVDNLEGPGQGHHIVESELGWGVRVGSSSRIGCLSHQARHGCWVGKAILSNSPRLGGAGPPNDLQPSQLLASNIHSPTLQSSPAPSSYQVVLRPLASLQAPPPRSFTHLPGLTPVTPRHPWLLVIRRWAREREEVKDIGNPRAQALPLRAGAANKTVIAADSRPLTCAVFCRSGPLSGRDHMRV